MEANRNHHLASGLSASPAENFQSGIGQKPVANSCRMIEKVYMKTNAKYTPMQQHSFHTTVSNAVVWTENSVLGARQENIAHSGQAVEKTFTNTKTRCLMLHTLSVFRIRRFILGMVMFLLMAVAGYAQETDSTKQVVPFSTDLTPGAPLTGIPDPKVEMLLDTITRIVGVPNQYALVPIEQIGKPSVNKNQFGHKEIIYDPVDIKYYTVGGPRYWYVAEKLASAVWILEHAKKDVEPVKNILSAEKFSGKVLYKLGATIDDLMTLYRMYDFETPVYWDDSVKTKNIFVHSKDKIYALKSGWHEAYFEDILQKNHTPSKEQMEAMKQKGGTLGACHNDKVKFKDVYVTVKKQGHEYGLSLKIAVEVSGMQNEWLTISMLFSNKYGGNLVSRKVYVSESGPDTYKFFIPFWEIGVSKQFIRGLTLEFDALSDKGFIGISKKYSLKKCLSRTGG